MQDREQKVITFCAAAGAAAAVAFLGWRQYKRLQSAPAKGAIRVGIIGTGWGVKVQLPQFRRAGLEVTAIASRSQENAITLAAQYHIASPYSNVIALCQSPDVDLVSVVTPPYLHAEQMIAALVGGKHVLVDKPMAMNAAEGKRMLEAASAHSKQVAIVDHELRFTPAVQRAREVLQEGLIGPVSFVEVTVFMPGMGGTWNWWSDSSQGGGVLGAVGSHVIDTHRFLLDCEFGKVSAHMDSLVKQKEDSTTGRPRTCTADDYVSMQYTLVPRAVAEDGAIWRQDSREIKGHFTIVLHGSPPPGATQFRLVGSKGSLVIDTATSSMSATVGRKEIASVKGQGNAFAVMGTYCLGRALQRALGPEQDRMALQPAATIADGLAVMYVMDAARESAEKGGSWVSPNVVHSD